MVFFNSYIYFPNWQNLLRVWRYFLCCFTGSSDCAFGKKKPLDMNVISSRKTLNFPWKIITGISAREASTVLTLQALLPSGRNMFRKSKKKKREEKKKTGFLWNLSSNKPICRLRATNFWEHCVNMFTQGFDPSNWLKFGCLFKPIRSEAAFTFAFPLFCVTNSFHISFLKCGCCRAFQWELRVLTYS